MATRLASQKEIDAKPRNLPRIGAAVVVKNDKGEILLGVRNKDPQRGKWVLPGGGIKPFESYEAAAKREILEETGLEIELDGIVGVYEIINPPFEHRIIIYNWGVPINGSLRPSTDISELEFCSKEKIKSKRLTKTVKKVLHDAGMA